MTPDPLDLDAVIGAHDMRMDAYYYSFDQTGVLSIDKVLSAVACAGKSYHHTEGWTSDCEPRQYHSGTTPAEWIQDAAEDAATQVRALVTRLRAAEAECARLRDVDALAGRVAQAMWNMYDDITAYERRIDYIGAQEHLNDLLLEEAEKMAQEWVHAARTAGACDHTWVDARNSVVLSGEVCRKCGAMRAGNSTAGA